MAGKREKPEDIVSKLCQVEVLQGQGVPITDAVRQVGTTQQTYYRWRKQNGGMNRDQLKRLKELEKENQHLRRAISDLTLDKLILTEAARGNQRALRAADGASAMCGRRLAYLRAAPAAPWDSTGSHSARFTLAGRTKSC